MCNMVSWKLSAVSLFAVLTIHLSAQDGGASGDDNEAILDTIAQINHINWVVNTIKTYKNPIVLEIESQKVSPGNLYLDRIPDRTAMERIKQILNTLHDLRMDEREMKRWREDFEERRDREQKTFLLKASKQAVDTMTKQVQECCSQWSWESNPVGSIAAVVNTAFNVVHCPVSLYNDYDNFVYAQNKAARDKQFDFDTAKLNLLHQQNIGLLEDQWNFITRYKLDDKLRVSDADIGRLIECLRDDNPSRIYTRLVPMSERFSLFPEYWYYLSCVAMETGHFKEGLGACDQFLKVNRHIFRDDPMEGIVAFNKAFMLPKTDANKEEVRRYIELASKNNVLRGDWQLDYLVAIMYKGVFGEKGKSEKLLERAIATIEQESHKRTRYGGKAGITLDEGLSKCRNALHELRGESLEEESALVSLIRTQDIVIYADDNCPDIIDVTNDVVSIRLPNDEHIHDWSRYALQMSRRGAVVTNISANVTECGINTNGCIMLSFEAHNPSSGCIDEYRLRFDDPNCPVEWTFRSIGYYYADTELNQIGKEVLELAKSQSLLTRFVIWVAEDTIVKDIKKSFLCECLSASVFPHSVSINGKIYHYVFSLDALIKMYDIISGEKDEDELLADCVRQFRGDLQSELNYEIKYMELDKSIPYFKRCMKDVIRKIVKRESAEH